MGFPQWNGIPDYQFGRAALHKKAKTVNSLHCHLSVSQLWPLSLWGRAHSKLQSVISALIFLWRRSVITDCGNTARSPLHLLPTALWQLNTQVRVFPLVSFWLAGLVRLSCLMPHHVWVVGLALAAPCHVVASVGIRNNKQTHQHRLETQTAMLWMKSTQFPGRGQSFNCPTLFSNLSVIFNAFIEWV